jgi:hypothetical protein
VLLLMELSMRQYLGHLLSVESLTGKRALAALLLAGATLLTGCATAYLDPATKDIPVAAYKKVDQPSPVHFVFEFQTKGAPNSRATEFLAAEVSKQVKESGLFAKLDAQGANIGFLQIILNNVPITSTSDATAKGFTTGLTFGLVGSSVSDGYICTISYLKPGATAPIVKTEHHAIHTTIGNASPPEGTIEAKSIGDAVKIMTHQIISNALNDLSHDKDF